MAMGVKSWSKIAANNATADSAAHWPEGMLPGQVNDSSRGGMASVAKWRDDISGVIVTSGTASAYTVASNQSFSALTELDGMVIAFTPHATNDAAPTLSVDGLAAKPLRAAHGADLQSNVLLAGTPYVALYSNASGEFVLQGMTANPYGIPLAASMDYWGLTTPSSAFAFPTGQAISRTTYAALFALIGTTYGGGDGSTTFNLPDVRGRVVAGKDDMNGTSANRLTAADDGLNGDTLGAAGGGETQVLETANLPPYTPAGTITNGAITSSSFYARDLSAPQASIDGGPYWHGLANQIITPTITQAASTFAGTAQGGTSSAFGVVQPTIIANKIMRII